MDSGLDWQGFYLELRDNWLGSISSLIECIDVIAGILEVVAGCWSSPSIDTIHNRNDRCDLSS